MAKPDITASELRKLFTYNALTGIFVSNRRGRQITCKDKRGYTVCGIYGKQYKVHRLAWLYIHGEFPANGIDHIDGDKSNNAIDNLREANQLENCQNMRKDRTCGSSGYLGVSFASGKWQARIRANGVNVYLGRFKSKEEAFSAYVAYKREHHSFCTI